MDALHNDDDNLIIKNEKDVDVLRWYNIVCLFLPIIIVIFLV